MNSVQKSASVRTHLPLVMAACLVVASAQVSAQGVRAGAEERAQAVLPPPVALPAAATMPAAPVLTSSGGEAPMARAARAARLRQQLEQGASGEKNRATSSCIGALSAPRGTSAPSRCD